MHELLFAFVMAYASGGDMPLSQDATANGVNARQTYAELFATTTRRDLVLRNVRWNDTRATADYEASVDGKSYSGSLTAYAEGGKLVRLVHDDTVWQESVGGVVGAGQIVDKGSTAVAMAVAPSGAEMNPALAGFGPAGMLALGAAIAGVQYALVRDLPLSECIEVTRRISAIGWGAGANNMLAMTGVAAPIAPLVGVVVGAVVWNAEYKGECVDGDIRVREMRVTR